MLISLVAYLLFPDVRLSKIGRMHRKLRRTLMQNLRAGDFAAIYRESDSRFKSVGSEPEFVSRMKVFQ
jgi:hypothetical protein